MLLYFSLNTAQVVEILALYSVKRGGYKRREKRTRQQTKLLAYYTISRVCFITVYAILTEKKIDNKRNKQNL